MALVGEGRIDGQGSEQQAPRLPPIRIGVKRTAAASWPSIRQTRQKGENSGVPSRTR